MDGPLKGVNVSTSPADHTYYRWAQLQINGLVPDGELSCATTATRREAAKTFIIQWCAAFARGERDVFEHDWCVRDIRESAPGESMYDGMGNDTPPSGN